MKSLARAKGWAVVAMGGCATVAASATAAALESTAAVEDNPTACTAMLSGTRDPPDPFWPSDYPWSIPLSTKHNQKTLISNVEIKIN